MTDDPTLILLRSIQDTAKRVELKVDKINNDGCAKRNGDLRQINSNTYWIRAGLLGLLGILFLVIRKWIGF
jgi:hypothetical protein